MNLYLNKPEYYYEMENVCRLFFPHERFDKTGADSDSNSVTCTFETTNIGSLVHCCVCYNDQRYETTESCPVTNDIREEEISMARGLYSLFSNITGICPKWGILTGVRPGKLYSSIFKESNDQENTEAYMSRRLLVQADKLRLCRATYMAEQKALQHSTPDSFSLYISIPFCPTRCSYCSFVSHSVEKTKKMVPQYVDLLCEELKEVSRIACEQNLILKTIYWGGGTPTQLSAEQLDRVMTVVEEVFDLSHLLEYTVEGGRPDTITPEKLLVLKNHGVDRLSINPQTMHNEILRIIGRRHTAEQVLEAFQMARDAGFDNINMDVIAGLPGDTVEGFCSTLEQLLALNPENITVHTLSIKRSSFLTERGEIAIVPNVDAVEQMLDYASGVLLKNGYAPYYLYRQSKMLGNQENVGWSKPGKDCLYNIFMMNELHTVLSAGAGAVTRLKEPHGGQIERIFNYKYPYEYIERFDTLIERKKGIGEFYEKYKFEPPLLARG
ncbi:MAG: coproporphyrinogen dehydrogenase HemZ [Clostridia bacterium]|nr:coproporphyrinogen dehydrogenase HemZ [Clostridia bacterium]